ncbi:MAG TPA: SAM-dependent chlorinase/fluorinase [Pyrinomonadaceae bacterium]|nr:SAM-dependent chlorinase/fluorinase [Pyrinomonadaceae bacterium]
MVIALLTDFGTEDYFVGAMKGGIFSINEKANIVDITHDIPPQNIAAARFTLRACYKNFPEKTTFVAVVDPGVGSERRAILVETENYYFIAPDNGLLSFVFSEEKNFKVYELTEEKFFAEKVSRTFHGRDIFAPIAAHLSKSIPSNSFGAEIKDFVRLPSIEPRKISEKEIEAEIIYVDRFGNLITNLESTHLPEKFRLEIGSQTIDKLQLFYAEAEKSELFMIFGSAGFLEIVAFQDSAKDTLKVETGEKILLKAD